MKKETNQKRVNGKNKILKGTIKSVRGNIAYFISDEGNVTSEISTKQLNTAMALDKVEVIIAGKERDAKYVNKVLKVISRSKKTFVGTIKNTPQNTEIIPDDKKIKLIIKTEEKKEIKDNTKVLAKILKWKNYPEYSIAEIIKKLGEKGENSTEMHSIVIDKGFEIDFPEKAIKESKDIFNKNKKIPIEEIKKRRDFRETLTFTIDPKTAKDFDDAISFKKLENGNFEISIHIADVSHYVTEKSELDREAYKRACSVYLPDRTIPMLPFELSDNLCSLNEKEEKLTFSTVFELDIKGKIYSKWFGKTIIKSTKRLTYETAQEIINKKDGDFFEELDILNKIAKNLRKEKKQKGAIDFEQEEIAFELDENGKPLKIYKKERLDTHKLVEEYMLLANKEVAEFVYKTEKRTKKIFPLLYRIHDLPNKDKIAELAVFVKALGHELFIDKDGNVKGKDMQALFAQIEGKAEESLVKTAAIRSMTKAIYSTKNIGHFGLAFEYYAHFTSPIRRYPDMLVHRILNKILSHEKVEDKNLTFYENASKHSTEQEIKASEAEREGKKYKQIEFMQDKIGKIFNGTITGVTEWGIYAEDKETKTEGMIKLNSLSDDFYILDSKKYAVIGEKNKKVYSLGQNIKIKLINIDINKKIIDYKIIE